MRSRLHSVLLATNVTFVAGAILGADAALAQNLEEIVVTAQRREQRLQDVPISVTALNADSLSASGVVDVGDLPAVTTGLVATTLRSSLTPYLRGVGTQSGTTEQSVAVYVDGVYIASPQASILSLNNIERIEVIKGPQGTLFGRNSTGGLIQVITADPSQAPEFRATAGYGNYGTWNASLYGTGGITDNVAADVAIYVNEQEEGWGKNAVLGNDVNLRQDWGGRSKVKLDLGEATTATLSGDYSQWDTDLGNTRRVFPGAVAFGPFAPTGGSIYDYDSAFPGGADTGITSSQYGASLRIQHDFSNTLSLTSTSAYRRADGESYNDSDGSPAVRSEARFSEIQRTLQQEFLLNATQGRLDWTAGTFLYRTEYGEQPALVFSTPGSPANASRHTEIVANSYSLFGQGSYHLTDATTLTLGLRYTIEDAEIEGRFTALPGNPNPVGTVLLDTSMLPAGQTQEDWDQLTWRLSLDHKFTDALMGYASISRGFKSGAYNPFDPSHLPVDPEVLDAYEIGLKSDLFDGALRLNGAAFYYDYQDIQLSTIVAIGTRNTNAAEGEIMGAEAEFVLAPPVPRGNLEIRGGITALDAEYVRFPNALFTVPRPPSVGGNQNTIGDASGHEMIRAPDVSSNLTLDYQMPLGAMLASGVSVTWQHMGEFYWDPDNRLRNDPYELVNAQLYLGDSSGRWRVRLWGRNLFDKEYFSSVSAAGFADTGIPGAPRTYGIALDMTFGP